MLRALREFSRGCLPRTFSVNGCPVEDSKSCSNAEFILLGNSLCKELKTCCYFRKFSVSEKFTEGEKKSDESHKCKRSFDLLGALGWSSLWTIGCQCVVPQIKSHIIAINDSVKNGQVPHCRFTLQYSLLHVHSMPYWNQNQSSNPSVMTSSYLELDSKNKNYESTSLPINVLQNSQEPSNKSLCEILEIHDSKLNSELNILLNRETKSDVSEVHNICGNKSSQTSSEGSTINSQLAASQNLENFITITNDHLSELTNRVAINTSSWNNGKAFKLFKSSHIDGNMSASFNLGICYEKGLGTTKNIKKAIECYENAASLGHKASVYNLAVLLLKQEDEGFYEKGLSRMEDAANLGIKQAQSYIGSYFLELGEWHKAVEMLEKAASQNDITSIYNLGLCYENGWGVQTDLKQAFEYFTKAASEDFAEAIFSVGLFHELGLAGLAENKEIALKYYHDAAEKGSVSASEKLEEIEISNSDSYENGCQNSHGNLELIKAKSMQDIHHDVEFSKLNFHDSKSSPILHKSFFNLDVNNYSSKYLDSASTNEYYPAILNNFNKKMFWIGEDFEKFSINV